VLTMIKRIEDLNFYELLEVSPLATAQEIHKAYERVRRVYEPNSIALYSLFTPEETAAIHQRVEEAYRTLGYEENRKKYDALLREQNELPEPPPPLRSQAYQSRSRFGQQSLIFPEDDLPLFPSAGAEPKPEPAAAPPAPAPTLEPVVPVSDFIGEFTGPAIKALREQRGLDLRSIADHTKVSARYLEYIEEENFQKLPARTYIRGFLMLYAQALGCIPERVAGDYLKRYDAVIKSPLKR
jgi:curved DNA-binding protein CbpA